MSRTDESSTQDISGCKNYSYILQCLQPVAIHTRAQPKLTTVNENVVSVVVACI
jgi:hypothetical protein